VSLPIIIAPSLLAADIMHLGEELRRAEASGADWLHLDIMDGCFVPNMTIGPPIISAIAKNTYLPLDVHLMIERPLRYLKDYIQAGASMITFHIEAIAPGRIQHGSGFVAEDKGSVDFQELDRLVGLARSHGKRVGLAINPGTPPQVISEICDKVDMVVVMSVWPGFGGQRFIKDVTGKINQLRKMLPEHMIEVDGGIEEGVIWDAAAAGANVFVAGTATFQRPDMKQAVHNLRIKAMEAWHYGRV
jgi:ribulose-phosphate 3-epimerase